MKKTENKQTETSPIKKRRQNNTKKTPEISFSGQHLMAFILIQLLASFFYFHLNTSNASMPPLPPLGPLWGICLPCQSRGVISKFCMVCLPWGHPRAFDTNVVSYPNMTKHEGLYWNRKQIGRWAHLSSMRKTCRGF